MHLLFFWLVLALSVSGQPLKTGMLKVLSEPAGAEITLNGKVMGQTPLKIINITMGEYRLGLRLQGYLAVDSGIKVTPDGTPRLVLALKPAAPPTAGQPPAPALCTLTVKTVPPGAALTINDQPAGVTPYHNEKLAPDTYRLRLEMAGYEVSEGSGTLKAGESRTIEKRLISLFGSLSVTSTPPGAALSLNDRPSGATPYKNNKLEPGDYALRLELPGYATLNENIALVRDSSVTRQFAFTRSKAWLDSVAAQKLAGYRHGRMVRRIWFACLAAAAAGTGYYFDTRVADASKEQDKIQNEYDAATSGFDELETRYDDSKRQAKKDTGVRNILYGVAGGFGLGFVISIPF